MDYFIDWLSVYQNHLEGGLPVVSKTINTVSDPETGEHIKTYINNKQIKGSYSSYIDVRCDGFKVSIDGNPSRWNRPDNLFGFSTFDECIRVFNLILSELNLPPFTKNTSPFYIQGLDGGKVELVSNGALITRVDWTKNLSVGEGNETSFLRALSTQSVGKGKKAFLFPNGQTVDWAKGSTFWYLKAYNKGYDVDRLLKKNLKSYSDEHKTYLKKVTDYCKSEGIVRVEKEFKSAFLKRNNLNLYGQINENDFIKHLNDIDKILERIDMSTSNYINISDQLLAKEAVKTTRAANTTQGIAFQWLHGEPFTGGKSQYHVHKKRLLSIGIDISIPFDATKGIPQIKNERVISVNSAVPPSWYKMPQVAMLRVA